MPIDMEEYYKIFNHYINVDILEANPELSKVTISDINIRTIKEEKKVAISFKENRKEFVLNKTNKNTLTDAFGDNPTTWVGKNIKLQIADVEFNGNLIKGIRIAIPEVEKKVEEEKKEKVEKKVEEEKKEKVEKKVEEETVIDSMINEIAKTRVCSICKKPKGDKEADLSSDGTEFVHSDCHRMQGMEEQAVNQNIEPEQKNDIKKEEPKICIFCKKPTTDGTMFADHPAHQECVGKLPKPR